MCGLSDIVLWAANVKGSYGSSTHQVSVNVVVIDVYCGMGTMRMLKDCEGASYRHTATRAVWWHSTPCLSAVRTQPAIWAPMHTYRRRAEHLLGFT